MPATKLGQARNSYPNEALHGIKSLHTVLVVPNNICGIASGTCGLKHLLPVDLGTIMKAQILLQQTLQGADFENLLETAVGLKCCREVNRCICALYTLCLF